MRKTLLLLSILLSNFAALHAQVPNIDFETGTYANWLYYTGSCCPIVTPTGGTSIPDTTRHRLTNGTATDPYGGFPVVSPWGGSYSMKLGNNSGSSHAERARYYVHIPTGSASYSLVYHYAVVLQDPSHSAAGQPRMEVKAFDSATGITIPCDSFCYVAGGTLPGFVLASTGTSVYYKPWTMGNLKLNGLGGRTIAVDFATGDCAYAGHFGYGYVDITPGLFVNTIHTTCASPTVTLSGPNGYSAYSWRDSVTLTTVYGTTQNVSISTPITPTTYAVILTPYSGYGCADTLYTRVIPIVLCSGTPIPGAANSHASAICGNPDTLSVSGYTLACGLTFQWQSSPDAAVWSNIAGATNTIYPYTHPYSAFHYRCQVTCVGSGITTTSSSVYVPGLVGPGMFAAINPPDTICTGAHFNISTCGTSTTYKVVTWYGDGTKDTTLLSTTGVRRANIAHNYGFSGTYTIKHKLYDGALAVDSCSYSYRYQYCSILPVRIYQDINTNCTYDAGDAAMFSSCKTEIDSNGIAIDTISTISGFDYLALGGPGTVYSFKVLTGPTWTIACPSGGVLYDTITHYVNRYEEKYAGFRYTGIPGFDLGFYTVNHFARGHHMATNIYAANSTCVPTIGGLTVYFNPAKWVYGSAKPVPTIKTANSLTWNLTDLDLVTPKNIYYRLEVEPSYVHHTMGDTVQSHYSINPISGDLDTSNNQLIVIDTITSSSDPNDISVSPEGHIAAGTKLRYTIRFENTGTDTAFNIHVMDTLSDHLDVGSIEVLMSSHHMNLCMLKKGGLNIVKFDFPDIYLPDSSHHGLCNGAIIYTINTKTGLTDGTIIPNRVGIYFDHNDVVMTNTVENIIGFPSTGVRSVAKNNVQVFPNPANDLLTIRMDEGTYNSFVITNTVGQIVIEQPLNGAQTKVNIKQLLAGIYYISLKGEYGNIVRKFVKM
ncbi:MAG: hypothetical protein K0Q79_405 [Flavipsychrobacter sp.]|jgi:uncharacterized repeat protein (TIGR01451 family)|nr:hypothetical protein [Flavipsychrobacter sp.]